MISKWKQFDFVRSRKIYFTVSIAITLVGIVSLLLMGLNLGVDFQSGSTMDIDLRQEVTLDEAREIFDELDETPQISLVGENRNRISARFSKVLNDAEREAVKSKLAETYGEEAADAIEENTVDAGMAREFGRNTILYVGLASLFICVYIMIRFEWRFAIAAIISLAHDAFAVITFFSLFRFEVNLPFIAAVLTIIGYSINDTIIIFDRIRENLRFAKLKTFDDIADVVNLSIRQTLTRSINTGVTVLFSAVCLYIFGGHSIKLFSLAMIFGLVFGMYSSIFIGSQIWVGLKYRSLKAAKKAAPA